MTRIWQACAAAAAMLVAGPQGSARADSPLPPPADATVRAPHGPCVAHAEITRRRVVVASPAVAAWTVPEWHRWILVADDCRAVGIGYEGGNLLGDADRVPRTAVMRFVHATGAERVVALGDLYPDLAVLPRTASHWLLFRTDHRDGRRWTVETVDGRSMSFEP